MLFFDKHNFTDEEIKQKVDVQTKIFNEPAKQYAVILYNDPINGVDYVAKIISSVFRYSMMKSVGLMLKAHFFGKSVLWIGSHTKAIEKQNQMIAFGADPAVIDKGAQTLRVNVELQA